MRSVTAIFLLAVFAPQAIAEEDVPASSCCSCDACNGCPVPAAAGRRLVAGLIPRTDCCNVCNSLPRVAPAAALRTAPPVRSRELALRAQVGEPDDAGLDARSGRRKPTPPPRKTWTQGAAAAQRGAASERYQAYQEPKGRRNKKDYQEPTTPTKEMDVVICRSQRSRDLFRRMTSQFTMRPEGRKRWSMPAQHVWTLFKSEMQTDQVLDESEVTPMLAIEGGKACAAAVFSDARQSAKGDSYENTYNLRQLITNSGPSCKGSGAALLCYLIRNSKDANMNFSPLKVEPIPNDVMSKRFFEKFGCVEPNGFLRMMDSIAGFMPVTSGPAHCQNPNPPACEKFVDVAFDADAYFRQKPTGLSAQSPPTVEAVSTIAFGAMIGLVAGAGAVLRLRRYRAGGGALIGGAQDPLLEA